MGTVQIRNIPDSVFERLKSHAAAAGLSLSDYLLRELEKVAETPTLAEMREGLRQLPRVDISSAEIAQIIREERDSH